MTFARRDRARGVLWAVAVAIGLVPLLWPAMPPLSDLPGHMGRWYVIAAIDRSADLARYWRLEWAPLGNLGLDIIVPALARVLPFEVAAKAAVMAIPALTMIGMIASARAVHGRVPVTAALALPFAYAAPFGMGFVNFALAQAFALCLFPLWLGLARRPWTRAAVFAVAASLVYLTHSFGWVILCTIAAGAEIARLRGAGVAWRRLPGRALPAGLPLLTPLALIAAGGPGAPGPVFGEWFDVFIKAGFVAGMLRDRWPIADVFAVIVVACVLYLAARDRRLRWHPVLAWPAGLCAAAFVLLPRLALGGAFVDMRMVPVAAALALLAIRPVRGGGRFAGGVAAVAVGFFLARTATTTASYALYARDHAVVLAGVDALPRGASVLALVAKPCGGSWGMARREHLPAMAIVRRDAFVNVEWTLAGQQVLRVRDRGAGAWSGDPSQFVYPAGCHMIGSDVADTVARFPRDVFTHLWLIGVPTRLVGTPDLVPVWRGGDATIYRVERGGGGI